MLLRELSESNNQEILSFNQKVIKVYLFFDMFSMFVLHIFQPWVKISIGLDNFKRSDCQKKKYKIIL